MGEALIFVHQDDGLRASVARYGETSGGGMTIEIAENAEALEAAAWKALKAQGWDESSENHEFACPPELATRAVFGGQASLLVDYTRFLVTLLRDMPNAQPEVRLTPALALERVKCIPSGGDWLRRDHASDVILMHEFLRRSAL